MRAEIVSAAVIPLMLLFAAIPMLSRRKDYFAAFTAGARDGLATVAGLLPAMIALCTALSMFRESGAAALLAEILEKPAAALGIPPELIPLIVTRPVSGSASTAAYAALMEQLGPDSFPALCAAILLGSSDTMLYILSVYFSAASVRRTRHAFPIAAAVMMICVFLSCALARIFFL